MEWRPIPMFAWLLVLDGGNLHYLGVYRNVSTTFEVDTSVADRADERAT